MPETKKCVGRAFLCFLANMNTSPYLTHISAQLKNTNIKDN